MLAIVPNFLLLAFLHMKKLTPCRFSNRTAARLSIFNHRFEISARLTIHSGKEGGMCWMIHYNATDLCVMENQASDHASPTSSFHLKKERTST